jgi:hypothetical protein
MMTSTDLTYGFIKSDISKEDLQKQFIEQANDPTRVFAGEDSVGISGRIQAEYAGETNGTGKSA